MYDKYKINMKTIAYIIIFALASIGSGDSTTVVEPHKTTVIDEDFLKRELQQSVLEFCWDAGIDPDSVYMPFRDSI